MAEKCPWTCPKHGGPCRSEHIVMDFPSMNRRADADHLCLPLVPADGKPAPFLLMHHVGEDRNEYTREMPNLAATELLDVSRREAASAIREIAKGRTPREEKERKALMHRLAAALQRFIAPHGTMTESWATSKLADANRWDAYALRHLVMLWEHRAKAWKPMEVK